MPIIEAFRNFFFTLHTDDVFEYSAIYLRFIHLIGLSAHLKILLQIMTHSRTLNEIDVIRRCS